MAYRRLIIMRTMATKKHYYYYYYYERHCKEREKNIISIGATFLFVSNLTHFCRTLDKKKK